MLDRLTRRRNIVAAALILTIYTLTCLTNSSQHHLINWPKAKPRSSILDGDSEFRKELAAVRPSDTLPHSRTLGVADAIFVISLARRLDRRESMDSIARALDLDFTYIDATDFSQPKGAALIERLTERVRWQRPRIDNREAMPSDWPVPDNTSSDVYIINAFPFEWSREALMNADNPLAQPLGFAGADYWDLDPMDEEWEKEHPMGKLTKEERAAPVLEASVLNNQNRMKPLTKATVACYHSHLRAIREIVDKREPIIL